MGKRLLSSKWLLLTIVILSSIILTNSVNHSEPKSPSNNNGEQIYSKVGAFLQIKSVRGYRLDTNANGLYDSLNFDIDVYASSTTPGFNFVHDLYGFNSTNQTTMSIQKGSSYIVNSGDNLLQLSYSSELILSSSNTSQRFELQVSVNGVGSGLYALSDSSNYITQNYTRSSWDPISTPVVQSSSTTSSSSITTTSSSSSSSTTTTTTTTSSSPTSSSTSSSSSTIGSSTNPSRQQTSTITEIARVTKILTNSILPQMAIFSLLGLVSIFGLGVAIYSYRIKKTSHLPTSRTSNQRVPNSMRCPNCAQRFELGDVYCQNCGFKLF